MASPQETTQSKYRLIRKPQTDSPNIGDSEVRITTKGRVARYVNYSLGLLEGRNLTDSGKDTTQDNGDEKKTTDQEQKTDQDATQATEQRVRSTKKFDTIILKATGRAITKAVTTAEVVKRRVPDLHQVNKLETLEIEDQWEPLEEGLKVVTTTRRVASISITLSRDENVIDKHDVGYQGPIPADAVNAKPPRESNRRGRGGRGRGGSWGFSRGRGGPQGFNRGRGGFRGFNRGRGIGRGSSRGGGDGFSRGGGGFSRWGGYSRGDGFSRGGYSRGDGFSRGGGYSRGDGFSRGGGYSRGDGFSRGRGFRGGPRGAGFRGRGFRGPRGVPRGGFRESPRGGSES